MLPVHPSHPRFAIEQTRQHDSARPFAGFSIGEDGLAFVKNTRTTGTAYFDIEARVHRAQRVPFVFEIIFDADNFDVPALFQHLAEPWLHPDEIQSAADFAPPHGFFREHFCPRQIDKVDGA